MASSPYYEPSIAPASFVASWRKKLRTQPRQTSSIYSIPDNDCPFEYDDEPLHKEADEVFDDADGQVAEDNNWAPNSPSVVLSELDNLEQQLPEVSMALAGTMIRQLDSQVQAMDEQIKQQDVLSESLQNTMEALGERYNGIDALEERVAELQTKLDALGENQEGSNAGRRSGGRSRQAS
ncbi:hypothetical protein N7509_000082 [Penicillium cosmopolitanum]|uniref:Uncharacterized protein n=1 Tax=Penicillium cosmopolitanum TaxID=1131564 RepID=A0A9W9WCM1_9EURO|nr:uncharacterized protein N7509_000082 [Penicillium cosmopolitanum]KAJ5414984.1 hypothetical protein N7509_000082 [Penicillium cosmopolitanum]